MKREGDGVLLEVIAVLTPTTSSCVEQEGDEDDDDDDNEDDADEETEDTFVLRLFSKTDETAGFLLLWEKMSPPLWGRRRGCSSWNRFVLQKPPVLGRCWLSLASMTWK